MPPGRAAFLARDAAEFDRAAFHADMKKHVVASCESLSEASAEWWLRGVCSSRMDGRYGREQSMTDRHYRPKRPLQRASTAYERDALDSRNGIGQMSDADTSEA
jgi:hypothetical protein